MPRAAFFACYLLTPARAPRRLRCTYVGFTVSPARRLRQHNGELAHGAKRTVKYRPWEMLGVVHGFPTKFHALQFEWAWQHPHACRLTRERLAPLRGARGVGAPCSVKRKLRELHEMLHLPPWEHLPLTVSYTSDEAHATARALLGAAYHWPPHMTCETRPLATFARLVAPPGARAGGSEAGEGIDPDEDVNPDACFLCERALSTTPATLHCYHRDCRLRCHAACLADHLIATADSEEGTLAIRPESGQCPYCARELLWPLLTQQARGPALSGRGASVSRSESAEQAERAGRQRVMANAQNDASSHMEHRDRREPGVEANAALSGSGRPEYDDSGWFEDDDNDVVPYNDSSDGECRGGGRDESIGENGGVQNQRARRAKSAVIDLTLDDEL